MSKSEMKQMIGYFAKMESFWAAKGNIEARNEYAEKKNNLEYTLLDMAKQHD